MEGEEYDIYESDQFHKWLSDFAGSFESSGCSWERIGWGYTKICADPHRRGSCWPGPSAQSVGGPDPLAHPELAQSTRGRGLCLRDCGELHPGTTDHFAPSQNTKRCRTG